MVLVFPARVVTCQSGSDS